MASPTKPLVLDERDRIVTVYAQPADGPGWNNRPLWVIYRDGQGNLRETCLQPHEQTPEMQMLYTLQAEAGSLMKGLVEKIVTRRPAAAA